MSTDEFEDEDTKPATFSKMVYALSKVTGFTDDDYLGPLCAELRSALQRGHHPSFLVVQPMDDTSAAKLAALPEQERSIIRGKMLVLLHTELNGGGQ